MGVCMLGDWMFRLDPETIRWTFSVKTKVTSTVGGNVVQVFGTRVEDLFVSGSFGRGGEREQERFLQFAQTAIARQNATNGTLPTVRFRYPPRGWDFNVYVKALGAEAGEQAIVRTPTRINHQFTLQLFIATGAGVLAKISADQYIARLATDGIGWKPNEYNGPASLDEGKKYITSLISGANTFADALKIVGDVSEDPQARIAAASEALGINTAGSG